MMRSEKAEALLLSVILIWCVIGIVSFGILLLVK